jgi:hypothetical protein
MRRLALVLPGPSTSAPGSRTEITAGSALDSVLPRESLPPGYPIEWEADVLLTDGGVAHLRPIRPEDAQLLVEFYDRV